MKNIERKLINEMIDEDHSSQTKPLSYREVSVGNVADKQRETDNCKDKTGDTHPHVKYELHPRMQRFYRRYEGRMFYRR